MSADRYGNLETKDKESWDRAICGFCEGTQMLVVAKTRAPDLPEPNMPPQVSWLRCVNCLHGVVRNDSEVSPAQKPLDTPSCLQGDELTAWIEVRSCLSVGATTAAVMLCRKLLYHVAVSHNLPAKDKNGRAPTYMEAVKHLESEGVITKHMRPWVDRIKDIGNEANHDLPAIPYSQAMDVAKFTRQLIHLAYELPAMVSPPLANPSSP
ncbi:hypothetical protein GCM10027088_36850 [Nocardia goodfellowii]